MSDWTRVDRKNKIFFHFLVLLCTKTVKNMLSWICWRYDSIFYNFCASCPSHVTYPLPLAGIILGKWKKDKKEIMTAIHCRKIFLKSCTFQFLSFLPLLHLRLETFLIVPITSGNLEKSQIFSAFLDLKTLPPKFKTCLNQSQPDIQSLHSI